MPDGDGGVAISDAVIGFADLLIPVHAREDDKDDNGDDEQSNRHAHPHAKQLPAELEALRLFANSVTAGNPNTLFLATHTSK